LNQTSRSTERSEVIVSAWFKSQTEHYACYEGAKRDRAGSDPDSRTDVLE
jgi:hypothetical protein